MPNKTITTFSPNVRAIGKIHGNDFHATSRQQLVGGPSVLLEGAELVVRLDLPSNEEEDAKIYSMGKRKPSLLEADWSREFLSNKRNAFSFIKNIDDHTLELGLFDSSGHEMKNSLKVYKVDKPEAFVQEVIIIQ
jgi:hypothetical protein